MGAVVGEKVTRAAEYAEAERVPLVIVSASGGARMQEGTLALMQLAKTMGGAGAPARAGVPYLSRAVPTRPRAACSRPSPRSGTSTSPSRTPSSGSPAHASRQARSPPSRRPGSSARSSCSAWVHDRIVPRQELRDALIAVLRLLPPRPDRSARSSASRTRTCRASVRSRPRPRSQTASGTSRPGTGRRTAETPGAIPRRVGPPPSSPRCRREHDARERDPRGRLGARPGPPASLRRPARSSSSRR